MTVTSVILLDSRIQIESVVKLKLQLNKQLVCILYVIRCDSLDIWYTKWEIIFKKLHFTGILQVIGIIINTMQDYAYQQRVTGS